MRNTRVNGTHAMHPPIPHSNFNGGAFVTEGAYSNSGRMQNGHQNPSAFNGNGNANGRNHLAVPLSVVPGATSSRCDIVKISL